MKQIESYHSSYPLSYYEIGTVYSFYSKYDLSKESSANKKPAKRQDIREYSSLLINLTDSNQRNAIQPLKGNFSKTGKSCGVNRFYAVVVDKIYAGKKSYIEVMFCNVYNGETEFFTKKYSVNHGCITDGKDLMPVSTHLTMKSDTQKRTGGITRVKNNPQVGGITKTDHINSSPSGVGGITKVGHKNSVQKTASAANDKIGGITRIQHNPSPSKKIGGITRVKK